MCKIHGSGFADEGDVVPILSAGHVNLTSANFAETLRKGGTLLIAASSRSCHKCIRYEAEYQGATADLEALGVSSLETTETTKTPEVITRTVQAC